MAVRSGEDPKRIVAEGYDRMGQEFSTWNDARPREVRQWFLGEVLARLAPRSSVLELGCGPGTDAAELSAGRRYVGIDLSRVQLSIARQRVPHATFVLGDFTSTIFRPGSFDGSSLSTPSTTCHRMRSSPRSRGSSTGCVLAVG
jgi:ubiquinone/menaquinone biosynthesis C-methylase UbiE